MKKSIYVYTMWEVEFVYADGNYGYMYACKNAQQVATRPTRTNTKFMSLWQIGSSYDALSPGLQGSRF